MTYLQPNKNKSIVDLVLAGLAVALVAGVLGMVALYNATVNLNYNITKAKAELNAVGVASTKLQNEVVQNLSVTDANAAAAADGLVADNNPQYFTESQPQSWPIASHF